jgi:hypothetical protein
MVIVFIIKLIMNNDVNITLLKRQIRVSLDETNDDAFFQDVLDTAKEHCFLLINREMSGFTGNTLPISLKRAILYLAADFNEFRESKSRQQVYKVPETVDALIYPYVNYGLKY